MEWKCDPVVLQKQPRTLFIEASRGSDLSLQQYSQQVAHALREGAPWDASLLQWLEAVPQTFLYLAPDQEVPPAALPVLLQHPWVLFQQHVRQPDAQLEMALCISAEYVFYLLQEHQTGHLPLFHDPAYYQERLLQDPFWALRWAVQQQDPVYYQQLCQHVENTCEYHPRSSALAHYLTCHSQDRGTALADVQQRLPVLLQDPLLAIWLHRQYPELELAPLVRSSVGHFPALVFWLQHGQGVEQALLLRELQRHPAWLAEGLQHCRLPQASVLWEQSIQQFANPWFQPWLERFPGY